VAIALIGLSSSPVNSPVKQALRSTHLFALPSPALFSLSFLASDEHNHNSDGSTNTDDATLVNDVSFGRVVMLFTS
jgi:hypothetical protein